MRKIRIKGGAFLLLLLGVTCILSSMLFNFYTIDIGNKINITDYYNESNLINENAKLSKISGPIHIIGNLGWVNAKAAGICTGSGNYSDPYIIEDMVIDGSGSGRCIYIENSDVVFEIKNCTLFNSISSGIRLRGISRGKLINNNCSFNEGRGIDITYTNDTEIVNNYVSNNGVDPTTGDGIAVQTSQNITVSYNNVTSNDRGMFIYNNQNCTISNNKVLLNPDNGILIDRCNEFIIKKNEISLNGDGIIVGGFDYRDGDNYTISENIISDNEVGGITLSGVTNQILFKNILTNCGVSLSGELNEVSSHTIDKTNLVNGKPLYYYKHEKNLSSNNFSNAGQALLVNCTNIFVSNLEISFTSSGLSLLYCNFSSISGITLFNNDVGVYLYRCSYSTVSGNSANGNTIGIFLAESNDNVLMDNSANYNSRNGIILWDSENNDVTGNSANNNDRDGIFLMRSNNNKIKGNAANYNTKASGIFLLLSSFNIISGNMIRHNDKGISLFGYEHSEGSNNNTVSENLMFGNNICISEVFSENNLILNNDCDYTGGDATIHGFDSFALIVILCMTSVIFFQKKKLK